MIPMCTVFGLKEAELQYIVKNQDKLDLSNKITDRNRDNEGIEIASSAYKVIERKKQQLDKQTGSYAHLKILYLVILEFSSLGNAYFW